MADLADWSRDEWSLRQAIAELSDDKQKQDLQVAVELALADLFRHAK